MVGDGQVTMGDTVVKPNARKVRQIRPGILAGFAGASILVRARCVASILTTQLNNQVPRLMRSLCLNGWKKRSKSIRDSF